MPQSTSYTTAMGEFYRENGYLVVERLFSAAELAPVCEQTDLIIRHPEQAAPGIQVGREGDTVTDKDKADAHDTTPRAASFVARFDPVFRQFAQTPKLLELVRGLLGPRIKVFRDQMLFKGPGGQAKPPHQDQSYFRVQPIDALVTAWIALDEATADNGCMQYVPGSHRHGIFEVERDPDRPVHHIPLTNGITLRPEVACPVPAGSVIFHHGCTLHRSAVNNTETWRRALIFHFATAEARSERDELNEQVTLEIDTPLSA